MEARTERVVEIDADGVKIQGMLGIPAGATGIVLFAHGSGSGRFSPRNQFVASVLRDRSVGTLLVDLLEEWESDDRQKVFDIALLADRLMAATEWLQRDESTAEMDIGYFGASTGAAAALQAAASLGDEIAAIVSRGGRPDLAMDYLAQVTAPTLLIVGGRDYPVIPLNQQAYDRLRVEKHLVIVPGATHLFEEPGALQEVARIAGDWFAKYLGPGE